VRPPPPNHPELVPPSLVDGVVDHVWPFHENKNHTIYNPIDGRTKRYTTKVYWGAHTGMRANPITHKFYNITPAAFAAALRNDFSAMTLAPSRTLDMNYYFLSSWNGWKEQAVLEPDNVYGTGFLDAVKNSLSHIASHDNSGTGELGIENPLAFRSVAQLLSQNFRKNSFYKMFHSSPNPLHSLRGRGDKKTAATENIVERRKTTSKNNLVKRGKKEFKPHQNVHSKPGHSHHL